jgi:hypothetical protein
VAGDSPFWRIAERLQRRGLGPEPHETLGGWLRRLRESAAPLVDAQGLEDLLALHQRLRFDPLGLSREEREHLAFGVERWLRRHGGSS